MSEDPTKNYPPPESYQTRNDLRQMLAEVVREALVQEVIPRFEHLESELADVKGRLERLEAETKAGFRKIDRRLNSMTLMLADNATRLDALEDDAA
ncbi:MAG: hypothetical protein HY774_10895 [Acidobacteria bacterium]|nr:hypothetical protein [Acidobacteriota bacterium]